jgi:hypothetical protein
MPVWLDVTCALQNCFYNNESVYAQEIDVIIK